MKDSIIAAIDSEIAKLQAARALIANVGKASAKTTNRLAGDLTRKKHTMTPEGRARIAEAVRKRWAKQKRAEKQAAKTEAK